MNRLTELPRELIDIIVDMIMKTNGECTSLMLDKEATIRSIALINRRYNKLIILCYSQLLFTPKWASMYDPRWREEHHEDYQCCSNKFVSYRINTE